MLTAWAKHVGAVASPSSTDALDAASVLTYVGRPVSAGVLLRRAVNATAAAAGEAPTALVSTSSAGEDDAPTRDPHKFDEGRRLAVALHARALRMLSSVVGFNPAERKHLAERALRLCLRVFGEGSLETAASHHALGVAQYRDGQPRVWHSDAALRDATKIRNATLGPGHPVTAVSMAAQGKALGDYRQPRTGLEVDYEYREAMSLPSLALMDAARDTFAATLGPGSVEYARALHTSAYGWSCRHVSAPADAAPMLVAQRTLEAALGALNPIVVDVLIELSQHVENIEYFEQYMSTRRGVGSTAERMQEMLDLSERAFLVAQLSRETGSGPHVELAARRRLAAVLVKHGRFEEALDSVVPALAEARRTGEKFETALALMELADAKQGMGAHKEAYWHFDEAERLQNVGTLFCARATYGMDANKRYK